MLAVQTINLANFGVRLPADRIGVVMSQPFLSLTAQEPYVTEPQAVPRQIASIVRTLEVAKSGPHQLDRTHLTVFPEYSVPGILGVQTILGIVSQPDWPSESLIVAGIDALSHESYTQLCAIPGAHVAPENSPEHVPHTEWINCSITLVKDREGVLRFWIQPKIWPAWEEQNILIQRMFRGRAINIFKGELDNGVYFRLVSLICFDWIATVEAKAPMDWVTAAIEADAGEAQIPLTIALVIQNNPKPSHRSFLSRIAPFFDQQRYPKVLRENATLLFCNSAGKETPFKSSYYGAASVLHSLRARFTRSHNTPTVSCGGARFRDGSDLLGDFNDSFLRERGACIHAFTLNNPATLPQGAAGRSFAVDDARVFSFQQTCPRAPDGPVAASVKWMNDALDESVSIGGDFNEAALAGQASEAHIAVLNYLRTMDARSISKAIKIASGSKPELDADDWNDTEVQALKNLAAALDILMAASAQPAVLQSSLHGGIQLDETEFDVLAVSGVRHEDCVDRARWHMGTDRSSLLVVSRDRHNSSFNRRHGSIFEQGHQGENRFTFPSDKVRIVGFQDLLEAFLGAPDKQALAVKLKGLLQ